MKKVTLGTASICYDNNTLSLISGGNRAEFVLPTKECPSVRLSSLVNVKTKYSWSAEETNELFNICDKNALELSDVDMFRCDMGGVCAPYIVCALSFKGDKADIKAEFSVYHDIGMFNLRLFAKKSASVIEEDRRANLTRKANYDTVFSMVLPANHYKVHRAELFDNSDYNNTYVRTEDDLAYASGYQVYRGHFMTIESYMDKEALLLVREAPSRFGSQNVRNEGDFIMYSNRYIDVKNCGLPSELGEDYIDCYSVTFGCKGGDNACEDALAEYRKCYRHTSCRNSLGKLFTISNTWGDRGEGKNINEAFMLREVEKAAALGVDAVQVDAGYNTPDYKPHPEKFPQGFDNIMKLCREKGTEFGIWFEPNRENDYEAWEKDADHLIAYYKNDGVTQMKVDAVTLLSRKGEENLRKMFEKFYRETEGNAQINNDITASRRFGFLYHREYANLFVANRYTAFRNYYPHFTLRGLWLLSKYVPLRRLLTEVPNRKLFSRVYRENDPFAPKTYEMDYLCAIAAFSNPLIWMEMYNLDEEDSAALTRFISAWKPHTKALYDADVVPVGSEPDGIEFTGFDARTQNGGYLMLFSGLYGTLNTVGVPGIKDAEILYKSEKLSDDIFKLGENSITVNINEPKSFVFMNYKK